MKLMLSLSKEMVEKIRKEAQESYRPVSKFVQMVLEEKFLKEQKS